MDVADPPCSSAHRTHAVENQPPPLVDYDVFASDATVRDHLDTFGAAWAQPWLGELGRRAGSAEVIAWGFAANENPPKLRAFDRFGRRIDEVEFHPAYHQLMATAIGAGLHSRAWSEPRAGAHVARAVGFYMWSQADAGHGCSISMTHAVMPALRAQPSLAHLWEPLVCARTYDGRSRPAPDKGSATFGMGMTEKQGGSDVRANTTSARAVPGTDGEYELTGHKWFCSAPMADAFLVLAQAPGGLSCFLVPRFLPDGTKNEFRLQRLKEKLGNRSNASSEVEFDATRGWLIGDEGRGVRVIVEMVNLTRLDCIIGSAAGMRQAAAQATHHAAYRYVFGKPLAQQPAMQNVLADLALEAEAATLLFLRLAETCDRAEAGDEQAARLRRIGTAIGKFWVCKRAAGHAVEALECLGGNGYVEESIMPRLVREAPLNSIWEGSGNVNALDVLRALAREPGARDAFFDEVEGARGADSRLEAATRALRHQLDAAGAQAHGTAGASERDARRIVERMALVFQGALIVRYAPAVVADAFCASRLGGDWGNVYGTLPHGVDLAAIVARATPHAAG